jgi:hypothetical protein
LRGPLRPRRAGFAREQSAYRNCLISVLALAAFLIAFQTLDDGVEYTTIDSFHIVRIDPNIAELKLVLASKEQVRSRTAGEWADDLGLVVAINAGMFQTDQLSNVGYCRDGTHENNAKWNDYQSVIAFEKGRAVLEDRGVVDANQFDSIVQNLRLIKGKGESVWKPNKKKWSEALAAVDDKGRILFIFTRAPFTMAELNAKLLALPLGIQRAMHLEGGPEASLSIRADNLKLDLSGSYETGFNENDDNKRQWAIPNVIGVVLSRAQRPAQQ